MGKTNTRFVREIRNELSPLSTPALRQKWVHQGKQRYKCKSCNYQWTENHSHRGRPVAERALAVFLYCHGLSMNAIAKMFHAAPSTILRWIRNFSSEHAQLPEPQTGTVVLELDEMWHSLKKKQTLSLESFLSGYRRTYRMRMWGSR